MTTVTGRGLGTQVVRIRARYAAESMSVIEAQDYLYDLACLVLVGYMISPDKAADYEDGVHRWPAKVAESHAARAARDTRVRSISYNSPLEIVLTISSLAGSAVLIAERLVRLYGDVQVAREQTASASTHVLRESIVRRHLEQVLADFPSEQGQEWIKGAARAAEVIEQLDIEPDH